MYLQKKKKANSTGEGSVEWIWYSQMEEILSQSKAINPDYIADSSTLDSDNEDSIDKENHDEVNEPQKKKKKSGIEGLPYSAAYSTPGTIQETQLRLNNTPRYRMIQER